MWWDVGVSLTASMDYMPGSQQYLFLFLIQALYAVINMISSLSWFSTKDQRATQHREWEDFKADLNWFKE